LNDWEILAAAPFYTYGGIYVEPLWGTVHGPSVSLMKKTVSLDFDREGVALQYRLPPAFKELARIRLTIRPEGEIYIDNVYIVW
jgi:hypothetical protein